METKSCGLTPQARQHIAYWKQKARQLEEGNVWRRQNKQQAKCLLIEPIELLKLLAYIEQPHE